jgi:hypothetical protein
MDKKENTEVEGTEVEGTEVENSRRKFIKTAAKIAVYTPPAMMIASTPSFAKMRTSGGGKRRKKKAKKSK